MRLALYQPDIPQNTGTLLRSCACLGVPLDIIEPAGFNLSDKALLRAGMDYLDYSQMTRHLNWQAFFETQKAANRRLILLTTQASTPYHTFSFQPEDVLLIGRESAGVPDSVHAAADQRLVIPIRAETRSLNMAIAAAMVLAEALRQSDQFPCRQPSANITP